MVQLSSPLHSRKARKDMMKTQGTDVCVSTQHKHVVNLAQYIVVFSFVIIFLARAVSLSSIVSRVLLYTRTGLGCESREHWVEYSVLQCFAGPIGGVFMWLFGEAGMEPSSWLSELIEAAYVGNCSGDGSVNCCRMWS